MTWKFYLKDFKDRQMKIKISWKKEVQIKGKKIQKKTKHTKKKHKCKKGREKKTKRKEWSETKVKNMDLNKKKLHESIKK